MVGATGFEPVTTRTPSVCATRLRYAPTVDVKFINTALWVGQRTVPRAAGQDSIYERIL